MGCVLNDGEVVPLSDFVDGIHVGGLTVNADGDDGAGALGDGVLEEFGIHVPRVGADVDEDGFGAEKHNDLGGGDPGVGDGDHFIAGAYLQRHEGNEQGIGAAGNTDAVFHPDVIGQFFLEFLDLGPKDELSVIEHCGNPSINFTPYSRQPSPEINK